MSYYPSISDIKACHATQKNKWDFFLFLILEVTAMVITGAVALTSKYSILITSKFIQVLLGWKFSYSLNFSSRNNSSVRKGLVSVLPVGFCGLIVDAGVLVVSTTPSNFFEWLTHTVTHIPALSHFLWQIFSFSLELQF